MKQLEYTFKVITNGTMDLVAFQKAVGALEGFAIASVETTNFKVVKGSK